MNATRLKWFDLLGSLPDEQAERLNMEISVHDNIVYGHSMMCENFSRPVYRLVLYTEYFGPNQEVEYTDIMFSNVLTHQFEAITAQTVILDIEETKPQVIYAHNEELFLRLKNYGWPLIYEDADDLFQTLDSENIRGFRVHSSCGLNGWIWAEKMELISRSHRRNFD